MRGHEYKRLSIAALFLSMAAVVVFQGIEIKRLKSATLSDIAVDTSVKRDLLALIIAYPDSIAGVEKNEDKIYAVMRSGKKILYDDGKQKTYEQKLYGADLQDMLEQSYPLDDIASVPEGNADPGRIRAYVFFKEVYGGTESETRQNLTGIVFGSYRLQFNQKNNAAASLKAAFDDILSLIRSDPGVYNHIYPLNGTYNYRVISGTNLLSPHAFGIAIDLRSDSLGYWRWATREQAQSVLDAYPRELVRVFENHGFIWGGKWAHFDIFHFEYRPELIVKAKYSTEVKGGDPWHAGFPEDEPTKAYIAAIDAALG